MAGSENQRLRPYNAPPEPRQKDMAKDPRDEHEDLLSTIDDALRDGRRKDN